jgi:putative aldouronate transport system permease protein
MEVCIVQGDMFPTGNLVDSPRAKRQRLTLRKLWARYWRNRYLLLLLLPGIVFYLIFRYKPMYGILIAFKDYRFRLGIMGSPWVGFDVFKQLLGSKDFWEVFRNTVIISSLKLLFGFPAPIILALLLNEVRALTFKRVVQVVSYLPYFISWVVLSGIFFQILSPSAGPVNYVIKALTGKTLYFLGDPGLFRQTIVGLSLWKGVGWGAVIYLAALAGVNPELYEAAWIDGAGRWQRVLHITLPSILPVITILFILSVGSIVEDDFDQIFNLYRPVVYSVGDVLSTYTYRKGLNEMRYSLATAVGIFQNVLAFILVAIANMGSKRVGEYGIW